MSSQQQALIGSSHTTSAIPQDFLAYFPLATDGNDQTGAHNGTATNVTFASNYASFNGTNSQVACNPISLTATNQLTFSCWINANSGNTGSVG